MSRFSKYLKEKVVKALVAALVVGSVAGNEGITAQAAEEEAVKTAVESVSDGNAEQMMVVIQSAKVTVDVKEILGEAYGYGIFVEGTTEQYGDSEANICTGNLKYNGNIGYTGVGTIYVDGNYEGSGSNIRCANLILNTASFEQKGEQWFVNGIYVGTTTQIGKIERGCFDLAGAFNAIRANAAGIYALGAELLPNSEGKYSNIPLEDGQNIYRVSNVKDDYFEPGVSVSEGKTVIFNIVPGGDSFTIKGQSSGGIENYPDAEQSNGIVYNFGNYSGTVNLSVTKGTIIAPNANVVLADGNNQGRVIAANFTSRAECHFKGAEWHPSEPTATPPVTTPPVTTPPVTTPPVTTPPVTTPPVTTPPVTTPPVTTPPVTTPPVTTPPVTTPPVTTPPVITPSATPTPTTPVVTKAPTPTPTAPVVTEVPTPTPTPTAAPSTPDTPDDSDDSDEDDPVTLEDPGTPAVPGTPENPGTPDNVTPETPQVLGARRRRVVTIEDETAPLADRAVLGASRRPQTGDDSKGWNLGFALSLTGLGAWLVIKKKEH